MNSFAGFGYILIEEKSPSKIPEQISIRTLISSEAKQPLSSVTVKE